MGVSNTNGCTPPLADSRSKAIGGGWMRGMGNCGVTDNESFKPHDVKDSDPCSESESKIVDSSIVLSLFLFEDPKVHFSLEMGYWFSKILWSTSWGLFWFTGPKLKCFETRHILV